MSDPIIAIDCEHVFAFYVDGVIDTYRGLNTRYLNVVVGDANHSEKLIFPLSHLVRKYPVPERGDRDAYFETAFVARTQELYRKLTEHFANKPNTATA